MGTIGTMSVLAIFLGQLEPLDEATELAPLEEALPALEETAAPQPLAQMKYPPGTVLYVNASSLALRTGPKRDAALVHYMQQDDRVVTLEDVIDPVEEKIGTREGYWIFIRHGQHQGYTFDAYLKAAPPGMEESIDWLCLPGERVGPITSKTTLEDLIAMFGQAHVRDARIPVGEGEQVPGTVIFPDNAEQRLFIVWEFQKVKPKSVIVEGTRWRTTKGIGIGERLSELVKANKAPISFAGFGWDYAGYVMSWRGGAFQADHKLRDDISLFLAPEQPYLPADYEEVKGDREFSSDLEAVSRLNLHVRAMTILLHDSE